jgi:hypothetical protein
MFILRLTSLLYHSRGQAPTTFDVPASNDTTVVIPNSFFSQFWGFDNGSVNDRATSILYAPRPFANRLEVAALNF